MGTTYMDCLNRVKSAGKIRVGVVIDVPGRSYLNPKTNRMEGFEADLGRLIAKELFGDENKIEFVKVDGRQKVSFIKEDKVDISISMLSIIKERAELIEFSKPYFTDRAALLVLKNSSIKSLADLKGKRVGAVATGGTALRFQTEFPDAETVSLANSAEAIEALKSHQIDALTAVSVHLKLFHSTLKDRDNFILLSTGEHFTPQDFGIGVKKGCADLLAFINAALDKFKASGTLDKLLKKHHWT
ncbi:MAG: transporter substrate-binding domain-containing protein [Chlamydiales bacterium]